MPIYSYKCNACGKTVDKVRKMSDTSPVMCDCGEGYPEYLQEEMNQVPAVPAPMQWGCRKGF